MPREVTLKAIRSEATEYVDDSDAPVYLHLGLSESAAQRRLTLDAEVDLCVKDATVGDVGALLASLCLADLVIPARRVQEKLSMSTERVALRRALEQVGLLVRGQQATAPATPSPA
jgi:hypothetical protein